MLLRNLNRIADVIEVPMRAEHDVYFLNLLFFLWTHGIAHDPGINQDDFAAGSFDTEGRVPKPGEFDAVQVHWFKFSSQHWAFNLTADCASFY